MNAVDRSRAELARSARAAFACATQPMKAALNEGGTADDQLTAMARGFADLVASEWGRSLSMLDVAAIPEAAANRVRRYRRLLGLMARNLLEDGTACGEFEVGHLDSEVHRWIGLADSLPRWLALSPEPERRRTARFVFESLAELYRDAARGAQRGRRAALRVGAPRN